jgi:GTP diphosphokinase / guanosine-3',5'-bis(diphosphate) 3'-diphosphatase
VNSLFDKIKSINSIEEATLNLKESIEFSKALEDALLFCIQAHKTQFRKSGEPYAVHPILVASITAHFSNDESMVIAALLHDVVEDTNYELLHIEEKYGIDVAHIVNGLTKISEIKEHELISKVSDEKLLSSALSFRKMLIASISDIRVLVVKLCDRVHNMLTLDAMQSHKQRRIAEETMVVYAPISHRLGISSLKNILEDLSFYYLYPKQYQEIDTYLENNKQKLQIEFNKFVSNVENILEMHGYSSKDIKIKNRIKHHYSIYLKMQRKGVNIDEILDISALRILVKNPIDCYSVLGFIHTNTKPLVSRFKDYVALPKENGYQTIHTTVFNNAKIYEVQIRTFDMDKIAEYGIAAHWIYKNNGVNIDTKEPCLNWLKSLGESNENIEEFYDDAKENLFSDEISIYSPKGDTIRLPRGSIVLDFAYFIHSDLGNKAISSTISKVKKPLITELKNGDVVSIDISDKVIPRCSWIDIVKTTKAKKSIKLLCSSKLNTIDKRSGKNIINTIFSRYSKGIIGNIKTKVSFHKIPHILDYIKHINKKIAKEITDKRGIFARFKIQNLKFNEYIFDNIVLYSNFSINSVSFDHCCHPKFGDDIIALKIKNDAIIHHKMCDKAYDKIMSDHKMFYCEWVKGKLFKYKMVVSLQSKKGELARLLTFLSHNKINILFIEYGKNKHTQTQYCEIEFETNNDNKAKIKAIIEEQTRVIEFVSASDAYK